MGAGGQGEGAAARGMVPPLPEIDAEMEGEDEEKLCEERGGIQGGTCGVFHACVASSWT